MRVLFLTATILSTSAAAQEPISADLLNEPLFESVQPEVGVSGQVIVGVMTPAAGAAILKDEIAVHPAAAPGQELCLRVASRDGIYTSRNTYGLPDEDRRPVLLPYSSEHLDFLKSYRSEEIAMTATLGNCDADGSRYLVVRGMNEPDNASVDVFLNSFGATDVFFQLGEEVERCEYLSEGRRTTFDYVCRVGAIRGSENVPVTIMRERFGREQPAIEISIAGTN